MSVTWNEAAADARAAFAAEWNVPAEGAASAIRAMRALLDRLEAHARDWEAAGWPDIDAPPDATQALRGLQGDSEAHRRRALELFEGGDAEQAVAEMRTALAQLVHPDLLPDLAITYRRVGDFESARHVMRAHLTIHPDDEPRRRRLNTYDGAAPPEEEDDVTAEWLDPERRPKPSPEFMMDSR